MATYAVGDQLRIVVYCKAGGQYGLNVHYADIAAKLGVGLQGAAFANQLFAKYNTFYSNLMSTGAAFGGITVQKIVGALNPLPDASTTAPVAGSIAGDILPKQDCGIITRKTDYSGRANRGRTYVPFPSEASSDVDGKPTAAYMLDLNALGAELTGSVNIVTGGGDGWTIRFQLHHASGGYLYLTGYTPRQRWATQRRRGDYGGVYVGPF